MKERKLLAITAVALGFLSRVPAQDAAPGDATNQLDPPASIQSWTQDSRGRFHLTAAFPTGQLYGIQSSSNLVVWRQLAQLSESNVSQAVDVEPTAATQGYYRLSRQAAIFHLGARHCGASDSAGPTDPPSLRWKFQTGGPVFSSPSVVGGVLYIGSLDTNLYAIDTASGTEKWHFRTEGPIRSSPAVMDATVYSFSRDGFLYAISASAGTELWRCKIAETNQTKSFDDYEYFDSSPAIVDGTIYIGSGDKHLYAIAAATGQPVWNFAVKSKISSPPAVADGVVYFGVTDGNFYAVDAATGTNLWSFKTRGNSGNGYPKGDILHAPVVLDGVVYFGSRDSAVYALDTATGKQQWRRDIMGGSNWAANSPAVHNGLLFVGSSITGALVALDTRTGNQKWQFNTYGTLAEYSSPTIANGIAYFGIGNVQMPIVAPAVPKLAPGYVQAVDIATHKEKWRYKVDGQAWSTPAVVDGVIYFGCLDGCVYALQ
jgi:outer membrane protein assembly factor BamB